MSGGTILAAASRTAMPKLPSHVRIPFNCYLPFYAPKYIRGFTIDPSQDFRCHVFTVPFSLEISRHLSRPGTRHAKVTDPQPALVGDKDICRLQVKMDKSV